jgi:hypothetical protein
MYSVTRSGLLFISGVNDKCIVIVTALDVCSITAVALVLELAGSIFIFA